MAVVVPENGGFLDCQIARLEAGLAGHMAVSSATVSDNYRGTEFLPAQVEP